MESKSKVIAVVGPTGSGKTALAVAIAKEFNGVIISADSRQVYRGLDVGTNKEGEPSAYHGLSSRRINGVDQLLIDVVGPESRFTLHDWLEAAKKAVSVILSNGQLPIITGGTGLYVTALLEGYQPGKGRFSKDREPVSYDSLIINPEIGREELNRRSDDRYPRIFDQLVAETKQLIASGVSPEWLISIGLDYRYAAYFIEGKRNKDLAIDEFQRESRAYIRRQLTWWRHHGEVTTVKNAEAAIKLTRRFLRQSGK